MKKNILQKLFSLLFSVLLLISFTLPIFAAEAEREKYEYDLSKEGSSYNKMLSAAEMLEEILGEQLPVAEYSYLLSYGDVNIEYEDGITTAKITSLINEEGLTVTADPYTYISGTGVSVTWLPVSASLAGEVKAFEGSADAFKVLFSGVDEDSETEFVDVIYEMKVSVSESDALLLLNQARNDIPMLETEIAERTEAYVLAKKEFDQAEEKYLTYLEDKKVYDSELEKYNAYLAQYRIYKEKLDAYNQYLIDKEIFDATTVLREKYEKELSEYKKNYPLYIDYLAEKREYDSALEEYNKFNTKAESFRKQLAIIDFAALDMTPLKRSALDAINGNAVTSVLAEKDALTSSIADAPAKVIDLAGEATANLRILLNDYFKYKTEQGKYGYYLENYEAFRDNFTDLFISLEYLYTNNAVRSILYNQEKDEKYRILVAQLYLIAHALSDSPIKSVSVDMLEGSRDAEKYKQFTYSKSFYMDNKNYGYTVAKILYNEPLLEDTNSARPSGEPFPAAVPEPIAPEVVEEPKEPAYVAPPDELIAVDDPGEAPTSVDEPKKLEQVKDPGSAPEEYIPPEEFLSLIAIKDILAERAAGFEGDRVFTLSKTVTKKFLNQEEVNVKFYSENGDILLYETTVDAGSAADFGGTVPTKAEDKRAAYTFDGWKNAEGEAVSLSSVTKDLILYPSFKETIKTYSIIFNVKGEKTEYILPYGSLPNYDGVLPEPVYDGDEMYVFAGWDSEPSPVESDAVYTAVIEKKYIAPSAQGGASVSVSDSGLVLDYGIAFDSIFDVSNALAIAEKEGGLTIISPFVTVNVGYTSVTELLSSGAEKLKLNIAESFGSYCNYSVEVLDKSGEQIDKEISVKVLDKTPPLKVNERLKLYYSDADGSRRYTKFNIEEGSISFTAVVGREYKLAYEYTVTAVSGNNAGVKLDRELFSIGENVEFELEFSSDVRVIRMYYRDSEGKEHELTDKSFIMPESDITLICEVEYIRYKINFVSGTTVISSVLCIKGQLPTPPENPLKASDGVYKYTFVGWSEELSPADGNKTYYAVFESSPVDIVELEAGMSIYQRVMLGVNIAVAAIIILAIVGIGIKLSH